jgi:hypothetical protein
MQSRYKSNSATLCSWTPDQPSFDVTALRLASEIVHTMTITALNASSLLPAAHPMQCCNQCCMCKGSIIFRMQRASPGWGGALSPFTDFGAVAPTFGRVGGFLRSIEQEMDQMLQVKCFVQLWTALRALGMTFNSTPPFPVIRSYNIQHQQWLCNPRK